MASHEKGLKETVYLEPREEKRSQLGDEGRLSGGGGLPARFLRMNLLYGNGRGCSGWRNSMHKAWMMKLCAGNKSWFGIFGPK